MESTVTNEAAKEPCPGTGPSFAVVIPSTATHELAAYEPASETTCMSPLPALPMPMPTQWFDATIGVSVANTEWDALSLSAAAASTCAGLAAVAVHQVHDDEDSDDYSDNQVEEERAVPMRLRLAHSYGDSDWGRGLPADPPPELDLWSLVPGSVVLPPLEPVELSSEDGGCGLLDVMGLSPHASSDFTSCTRSLSPSPPPSGAIGREAAKRPGSPGRRDRCIMTPSRRHMHNETERKRRGDMKQCTTGLRSLLHPALPAGASMISILRSAHATITELKTTEKSLLLAIAALRSTNASLSRQDEPGR